MPKHGRANELAACWPLLVAKRVLVFIYEDLTWEPWRIQSVKDARAEDGGIRATLELDAIRYDLGGRQMRLVNADGSVTYQYGHYGRLVSEHLDHIIGQSPPWFYAGRVERDDDFIDLDFKFDSCQAALEKLRLATKRGPWVAPLEVEYEPCESGILVHLVEQAGSGAAAAAPVPNFTWFLDPLDATIVYFMDTSTPPPGGAIVSWLWDFDDASTSTVQHPTHDYAAEGDYDVMLTVTDERGVSRSITRTFSAVTPPSVPDAPTSLVAMAIDDTSIGLTWDAPVDDGGSALTGYQIEAETPIGGGWSVLTADTGDTMTTAVIAGLTASTEYNFRVSAINAIGTGPASNEDDATTDSGVTPPTAPAIGQAAIGTFAIGT
jgi:PKD repeat protein